MLSLLHDISKTITKGDTLEKVMQSIITLLCTHIDGVERILLSIFNKSSGQLVVEQAWGITEDERIRGIYRIGEGITGQVIQTGKAIIVPSIAAEPAFLNRTRSRQATDLKTLAFICVPIFAGRDPIGTLSIDCPNAHQDDLDHYAQVLEIIAGMIGQSVLLHQSRLEENTLLHQENKRFYGKNSEYYHPENMIGVSKPMTELYQLLEKVYNRPTTVLILGESGTGKELVANAIHFRGNHPDKPFIKFNCAALPENLAESELFGHEKGAFTGAMSLRKGKFEEANGGTLFLDEIGELSLSIQAKLLRVLQSKEFERVGGSHTIKVDVRFIAATNRDLVEMVAEGKFREDLYYRLNVFPIVMPPLRNRGADIMLLADYFTERFSVDHGVSVSRISTPAIDALLSYHWPGNVRELQNVIERGVLLSTDGVIHSYHLPPSLQTAETSNTHVQGGLQYAMDRFEREILIEALKDAQGNMAEAARHLELTERVMALRMKKFDLDYKTFRKSDSK